MFVQTIHSHVPFVIAISSFAALSFTYFYTMTIFATCGAAVAPVTVLAVNPSTICPL